MALADDVKKAALLAAQKIKRAFYVEQLPTQSESLEEMEKGSPSTPGYEPNYGQTIKPPPLWPVKEQPTHTLAEPEREAPDTDIDR